jgi:hypothetical protein
MKKAFVIRGQTNSGETEVLNFSGYKPGYAYRLVEFRLWPQSVASGAVYELNGTITAGKVAVSPIDYDFSNEGLIGVAMMQDNDNEHYPISESSLVNDTFLITQNLILMVQNTSSAGHPVNWQCRFESVKMTKPEEAVTNYKQFMISDGS